MQSVADEDVEVPLWWFPQPVYFASIMRRHMIEFGRRPSSSERSRWPLVASEPHPRAVMRAKPMDLDDYLASAVLADPLHLFDSCLISDGGAAYVTTSTNGRGTCRNRRPWCRAWGRGSPARVVTGASSARSRAPPQVFSAPRAFTMAGVAPADVDVLTLYGPFTVVTLDADRGHGVLPRRGRGVRSWRATALVRSGGLPYNTHGGLLSHTYVLGIAHVVEMVKQMRGTAPAQVPDCEVAVYGGYTGQHGARSC